MNNFWTLISQNPSELFGLGLFLIDQGITGFQRLKDGTDKDRAETIRDYLEWYRRQDQNELVHRIRSSKDSIQEMIFSLGGALDGALDEIKSEIANRFSDLVEKFNSLDREIPPPALSTLPLGLRTLDPPLVFEREDVADILDAKSGDVIVTGQPGAGKTFFLHRWARTRGGRFVVSPQADGVAAEVRTAGPVTVIVDDAAQHREILPRLLHVRNELGLSFRILVVCWPHEVKSLKLALSLSSKKVVELPLLGADQIAALVKEVIKSRGFEAPNHIVREIRRQAAGRPGLAIRITEIALEDGIGSILDATALRELMARAYSTIGREEELQNVLACFAVGGAAGMLPEDVSKIISIDVFRLSGYLHALATGGIVDDVGDGCIACIPDAFRHGLIREVFFTPPVLLRAKYESLFAIAPNKDLAISALLGAVRAGADFPDQDLRLQLARFGTPKRWAEYASLSETACSMALDNRPDLVLDIAEAGFHYLPEKTLRTLLDHATKSFSNKSDSWKLSLSKIREWVAGYSDEPGDAVHRRTVVLQAVVDWETKSGFTSPTWHALLTAISLSYRGSDSDPGEGKTFTFTSGIVSLEDAKQISGYWDTIFAQLIARDSIDWSALFGALHAWMHPFLPGKGVVEELRAFTSAIANSFIHRLLSLQKAPRNAIAHWAKEHGIESNPTYSPDPQFATLFPVRPRSETEDTDDWFKARGESAAQVGVRWAKETDPFVVANRLKKFEAERGALEINWPDFRRRAAGSLASSVTDAGRWCECFMDTQLPSIYVQDPMRAAIRAREPDFMSMIVKAVQSPAYVGATIEAVLPDGDLTDSVGDIIGPVLSAQQWVIKGMAIRGEISPEWIKIIRVHGSPELQIEIALYDFSANTQPFYRGAPELWLELFRAGLQNVANAIREHSGDFDKIAEARPELAIEVAEALIRSEDPDRHYLDGHEKSIFANLTSDDRVRLLRAIAADSLKPSRSTIKLLVGNDQDAYLYLLNDDSLGHFHGDPLAGSNPADPNWQKRAITAAENGCDPEWIARAPLMHGYSYTGNGVAFWQEKYASFEELSKSQNPNLLKIANAGINYTTAELMKASKESEQDRVYGIDGRH